MTKFVVTAIAVAFTVVFSAAALADGWKIGNWEPPTKAPVVKAVSFNADWGTPVVAIAPAAPVAPARCSGMAKASGATWMVFGEPARRNGRGGGWFPGKWIMANRQARANASAQARMGSVHLASLDASGHS